MLCIWIENNMKLLIVNVKVWLLELLADVQIPQVLLLW